MGNISGSIVNITPVFWSQNIVFVRVEDFVNINTKVFTRQMNIECRNGPVEFLYKVIWVLNAFIWLLTIKCHDYDHRYFCSAEQSLQL